MLSPIVSAGVAGIGCVRGSAPGQRTRQGRMSKVAVVGCGVVGASWALVFSRAGFDVSLYDASPAAQNNAVAFVRSALMDLKAQGLAGDDPLERVMARLATTTGLDEALAGADYVQESAPERLEIKRELYKKLDTLAAPDVTIGSSTSGLPASSFTEGLANAQRCLVVHPINPPHLIPLVEIVPAPWTAPEAVEKAARIMREVGQSPIRLTREINGFVVNRLQSAMLAEAFRLVEDGICDAGDVDKAVADGLGLRWFFMGPFETIDLNAQKGIAEYCKNLGPMYYGLAKEQADPRDWSSALVKKIEDHRRLVTPADRLPERRSWRDRCLAALVRAKRQVLAELGP
jgi:L-gulonate 3-dehydrogenase